MGLWRVAVGILKSGKAALVILPISNRDIAARGYPVISGWGQIRSPFAHSKRGKPHIFPRKIEAASVRVQICSRKIPDTLPLVAMLYKVTFQTVPKSTDCVQWWFCVLVTSDKKQNGSRTAHFYAFPICGDAFVSCCQSAYFPGICI
ncbi:hypothetical protein D3Z47_20750 [Lachnospiraceae bacterium]|nr:hypothetical protein [Lachnospiraceae bacterium]